MPAHAHAPDPLATGVPAWQLLVVSADAPARHRAITALVELFAPVAQQRTVQPARGPTRKSWLDYRMKKGAGKKSSPLDYIRPEPWTAGLTQELIELLWVLERTLAQYPILEAWLDEVLASELFTADEIPPPTDEEKKEPKIQRGSKGSLL